MTRTMVTALLLVSGCAKAVPQETNPVPAMTMESGSYLMHPGVLIAPGEHSVFAQNTKGGLFSLDLGSGKLRWETEHNYTPLLAAEGQLAVTAPVQGTANRLKVAWLDAGTGKVDTTSSQIVLPDWVSVIPAQGCDFQVTGRLRDSAMLLDWSARSFYAGGARPTSAVLERARKEASGRVLIDPASGEVAMLAAEAEDESSSLPETLREVRSGQYWNGFGWTTRPVLIDKQAVTLELESIEGRQQLSLVTWEADAGRRLKTQPLITGHNLRAVLSADRQQLWVSDTHPGIAGRWTIFQLATGKQRATFESDARLLAGFLVDSRALLLEDRTKGLSSEYGLQSVDVDSGQVVWSTAVQGRPRFSTVR